MQEWMKHWQVLKTRFSAIFAGENIKRGIFKTLNFRMIIIIILLGMLYYYSAFKICGLFEAKNLSVIS